MLYVLCMNLIYVLIHFFQCHYGSVHMVALLGFLGFSWFGISFFITDEHAHFFFHLMFLQIYAEM